MGSVWVYSIEERGSMAKSTLTALSKQIADLASQVQAQIAALNTRMDRFEQMPAAKPLQHANPLLDPFWIPQRRATIDPEDLGSVLRSFERDSRTTVAAYYLSFGALYASTGIAILAETMTGVHVGNMALRVILALFYWIVGAGLASCVFYPQERHQLRMVIPTISAAAILCLINAIAALQLQDVTRTAFTAIIWAAMTIIHFRVGLAVRGRIAMRDFLLGFARRLDERRAAP
jgi:hypothetical protein